jgi:RNA polymerase sigma factor (TIGR02999 family)
MLVSDMIRESDGPGVLEDPPSPRHAVLDRLLPAVYNELRAIAHKHLTQHGHADSLATTGLVHEAYLKLVDQSRSDWRDRAHFFALTSVAMRHVLLNRARSRATLKRGGVRGPITLDEEVIAVDDCADALLAVDDALERLAAVEPRLAKVVEYRFFGGLSEKEIAEALGVTERTVERDWVKARMLLRRALAE